MLGAAEAPDLSVEARRDLALRAGGILLLILQHPDFHSRPAICSRSSEASRYPRDATLRLLTSYGYRVPPLEVGGGSARDSRNVSSL